MTIFAFMTHAHNLGSEITGYIQQNGALKEFARGDPQKPQTFHKMHHFEPLNKGDVMNARCSFDGTRANKTTSIGMFKEKLCLKFVSIILHQIMQGSGPVMQCASFLSCISLTQLSILYTWISHVTDARKWPKSEKRHSQWTLGEYNSISRHIWRPPPNCMMSRPFFKWILHCV